MSLKKTTGSIDCGPSVRKYFFAVESLPNRGSPAVPPIVTIGIGGGVTSSIGALGVQITNHYNPS